MTENNQQYSSCPICNNLNINLVFKTYDFSLTKESFEILACPECDFQYTFPIPEKLNIGKYYNFPEYISHTDTKKGWLNRIYHMVRQLTLKQKAKLIQSFFGIKKGKILDIGAGTGAFVNTMKTIGWEVVGLEPDAASRSKALSTYGIQIEPQETLFNLPKHNFDVITLWHVLEHVHELNDYLVSFNSLLNTDGKLIIAVPNHTSFDAQYYKHMWAAYDVPRHLYHFSPQSMKELCSRHNFEIIKYKPMWFDSFYVSLLTEKYIKWGLFGTLRAIIVGSVSNFVTIIDPKKSSSLIYIIQKKEINNS